MSSVQLDHAIRSQKDAVESLGGISRATQSRGEGRERTDGPVVLPVGIFCLAFYDASLGNGYTRGP